MLWINKGIRKRIPQAIDLARARPSRFGPYTFAQIENKHCFLCSSNHPAPPAALQIRALQKTIFNPAVAHQARATSPAPFLQSQSILQSIAVPLARIFHCLIL